mmetsp:Transcript_1712/g.6932  ORF Transcript_1712/g.6932 Transcript_1712/m.6932 type:complete len:251 (+) Transcript_1712:719-1471(+)
MAHHGDERVDVIRVHVRRDGRAEPRDRVRRSRGVLGTAHPARAREPADEPRAQYPVHAVPREIAEIDPEGVGMLGEVRLPGGLLVGGVGDRGDGSGDGDARVRGAGEPGRGDGERALAVRLEVSGVSAHGREREDGSPFVVRGEADDGSRGVLAAVLPGEGGDDAVPAEVHERAALVRERELRRGGLVLPEGDDLGVEVLHGHRAVRLDLVRADDEEGSAAGARGGSGGAGGVGGAGAEREGRGDEPRGE